IFFGSDSANNKLGKYDPATDTFTDLSSRVASFGVRVQYLTYDFFDHLIFFGSGCCATINKLGKYDPATDTFTDLSGKATSYGTTLESSIYDSFNHLVFFGSTVSNKFARFNPSLSKHTDNLLFFDEKDYSGVAASDDIYSSVTSYGLQVTSYPSFLFKQKNPTNGPSTFRVTWEGQTSSSANPVLLQIYDFTVDDGAATSTTAWKTIATSTAITIDTDFTLTADVTASFPTGNDTSSTAKYFTRHQNGVDPLATSTVQIRVIQMQTATAVSPITLRTDLLSVSFGSVEEPAAATTLTQNRFRFFANTDTVTTTDAWPQGATDLVENEWIGSTGTPPITGTSVRMRINIDVAGSELAASATSFRLQYAKVGVEGFSGGQSASSCSAIPAGDWVNLGDTASTAAAWRGYDNASAADDATISSTDLRLSDSDVAGTYEETPPTSSSTPLNPNGAGAGQQIEYDFVVQNNLARGGAEYCFRMVQSVSGVPFPLNGGYSAYPRIHVNEELTFSLDKTAIGFGLLGPSNNYTSVTTVTSTVITNASFGYIVRAWTTSRMTHANLAQYTISDWTGTNAAPSTWTGNCVTNGQCGFGYATDDGSLTGGTFDRFTNPLSYAGFIHGDDNANGDPIADETATSTTAFTTLHQYQLKLSTPSNQAAGTYRATAVFIATPTF
ncbi:MAG: hypothetical protein Q8Q39_03825, partial [bacterium]|nr:hypothetical protein [bacterium]